MTGIYDVTEAFSDIQTPVGIVTQSPGEYVEGKWVDGIPTTVFSQAVPHPMNENEINEANIEGYLGGEMMRFYFTDTADIEVTDNPAMTKGDELIYQGNTFLILKVDDWKRIGGYTLVYSERRN